MKNIHILPTDNKYSRLYFNINDKEFQICENEKTSTILKPNRHIYITNDEEIKARDWFMTKEEMFKCTLVNEFIWRNNFDKFPSMKIDCKKIILTTDQDLIKDGVQAIDDEFLEWFVKNPSCEEVEVTYGVLKPFQSEDIGYLIHCPDNEVLEEPKQETTLEDKLKLLVEEWHKRQINYETSANNFIEDQSNNRKFTYKAMATRDCWKELLKLIEDGK